MSERKANAKSRGLLEQLIEKAFSDDEQIDETEYFNLKLTSDAAGYTEDELDKLIRSTLNPKIWRRIMRWSRVLGMKNKVESLVGTLFWT